MTVLLSGLATVTRGQRALAACDDDGRIAGAELGVALEVHDCPPFGVLFRGLHPPVTTIIGSC